MASIKEIEWKDLLTISTKTKTIDRKKIADIVSNKITERYKQQKLFSSALNQSEILNQINQFQLNYYKEHIIAQTIRPLIDINQLPNINLYYQYQNSMQLNLELDFSSSWNYYGNKKNKYNFYQLCTLLKKLTYIDINNQSINIKNSNIPFLFQIFQKEALNKKIINLKFLNENNCGIVNVLFKKIKKCLLINFELIDEPIYKRILINDLNNLNSIIEQLDSIKHNSKFIFNNDIILNYILLYQLKN